MGDEDPRKIISSALISAPNGVTLFRLLQDYREFTGQDVPFRKLGFSSFEQYLQSIPGTCRVTGSGQGALVIPVVNEQNKHINDMILKQKAPKTNPRYRNRNIKRSRGIYDCNASYQTEPCFVSKQEPKVNHFKLPDTMSNSNSRLLPPPPDYFNDIRRKRCEPQNRSLPVNEPQNRSLPVNEPQNRSLPINESQTFNQDSPTTSKSSFSYNSNTASLHHDIAAALSEESDYDEYFNDFDVDSEDDDFYYKSDSESVDLSTSSNCLQVSSPNETSIPLLYPQETSRPEHISIVNDNVKNKLRQLISEHPEGIWCSKLVNKYWERFQQKLDPLDFGFSSVIQLCDDVPDVFHCIRPNRMDWKLYDSRNPVPDIHSMRDFSKYLQNLSIVNHSSDNTEPPLPDDVVHFNPSYKYPETVLHPDETIVRLQLPGDDQMNQFIEVIVAEVYDPSKFWIQLKGPNTFDALEELMDTMQTFYMHNAGALQLNEFSVRIGLFVAALFSNEYHRAVVIKVFSDQTLKVFYIDYGTVGEVSLRKTCLLHRNFTSLPQQAIRSRLDNIVPVEQNTMWSREASQSMLNMVMDKTLFGLIRRIDRNQQILHLILTDTTQDTDIHINDELIYEGFAELGNEAPLCSTSSAIVPNVHLFPSFEEIENYIYPNVDDVCRLLKIGQTYETIYHGYFDESNCPQSSESYHISNSFRCKEDYVKENIKAEFQTAAENIETKIEEVKPVKKTVPPGFENVAPSVHNFMHCTSRTFNSSPDLNQVLNKSMFLHLAVVNPLVHNQQQQFIASKNKAPSQESSHAITPSPTNMYDRLVNSKKTVNSNDCLLNESQQLSTRNVIQLNFENFNLHVIKLENNYFIASQEIITTLLRSDLSLKSWLQHNNLTLVTFPNKLINLSNYAAVYNELTKFSVPGIYKASNLGCNTRMTLLQNVVDIIYKYGDVSIIPELRNTFKNATESQYLWEVLHSSD